MNIYIYICTYIYIYRYTDRYIERYIYEDTWRDQLFTYFNTYTCIACVYMHTDRIVVASGHVDADLRRDLGDSVLVLEGDGSQFRAKKDLLGHCAANTAGDLAGTHFHLK